METKLFGLDWDKDALEVVERDGRFFMRYDASAHATVWREDEITAEDAQKIASGRGGTYEVIIALQRRLGLAAYESNWSPPS